MVSKPAAQPGNRAYGDLKSQFMYRRLYRRMHTAGWIKFWSVFKRLCFCGKAGKNPPGFRNAFRTRVNQIVRPGCSSEQKRVLEARFRPGERTVFRQCSTGRSRRTRASPEKFRKEYCKESQPITVTWHCMVAMGIIRWEWG
jgi:hypothetical protein